MINIVFEHLEQRLAHGGNSGNTGGKETVLTCMQISVGDLWKGREGVKREGVARAEQDMQKVLDPITTPFQNV